MLSQVWSQKRARKLKEEEGTTDKFYWIHQIFRMCGCSASDCEQRTFGVKN